MSAVILSDVGDLAQAPLCPPGVRYPEQGRRLMWCERTLVLVDAIGANHLPDGFVSNCAHVRWNGKTLSLEAPDGAAFVPLHLHPALRHILAHCTLLAASDALATSSVGQRSAMFIYARRYKIRTLLLPAEAGSSVADPSYLLADALALPSPQERDAWRMLVKNRIDAEPTLPFPQVLLVDGGFAPPLPEVAAFRGTITLPADRSAIIDALDERASAINLAAGVEIVKVKREGRAVACDGPCDWLIVAPSDMRAWKSRGDGHEPSHPRGRLILVATAELLRNQTTAEPDVRAFIECLSQFELVVFESTDVYRDLFLIACKFGDSIYLLRNKSVLLESSTGETASELCDRLFRALRIKKPMPIEPFSAQGPGLHASPFPKADKKLSICVSTYNRAHWLRVTIPLLIKDMENHREDVEFIVVDNASTDDTELVMNSFEATSGIVYHRNERNVGMLGNLAVSSAYVSGDYVWILGDDDLVKPGTVAMILDALKGHPRTELLYINYAYTHFDSPEDLLKPDEIIEKATPISEGTITGFYEEIKEFTPFNENFFTAIYACVFRRDHAVAAYTQFTDDPPFSSMRSCIPTTYYILENMLHRPGYWIGTDQLVVNMNVSWMRYATMWHMERLVEVFDRAEELGVPARSMLKYRKSNIDQAIHFLSLIGHDSYVENCVNLCRYIESMKTTEGFAAKADQLLGVYETSRRQVAGGNSAISATALRTIYELG
jgi:glycosyltransferase involved in cell wall biosynthesis